VNGEHLEFQGFEWDEAKSRATLAYRAFDFEFAARVFEDIHVETEDRRHDYGERRFVVTGEVDQRVITVVWTPRGQRRRIVSAWPASNRERREYCDYRQAIDRADSGV
jgi:uncharacterized protein